ncbi:MAG TPA: small ribosomal subunit Rsm22 family protein [Candidatus Limnocylindria bacterium]|nr:small ribosomal subunit Rsm22 family protein [Candidatus Limnocylindria bacterium]
MNPETLDWSALDRLRETFLNGKAAGQAAYWRSRRDLADYDATFGERIGWKWDTVLQELKLRGWTPPVGPLLDFGCGSGIAGRRVLCAFGAERFPRLMVHDRSPLAEEFALGRAREQFSGLTAVRVTRAELAALESPGTLVVSHVLNELPENQRRQLLALASRAQAVIWVEPGTHADSRELIGVREALQERFVVVAPCTHCEACGLLSPGNERHWCHNFAAPPPGIFADSGWTRFARRAGIDLRSLPYSMLVLERKPGATRARPLPEGVSRVLGAPRYFKGYLKLYSCDHAGVRELTLQKRDAPERFAALEELAAAPLFQWNTEADRIHSGEPWPAAT